MLKNSSTTLPTPLIISLPLHYGLKNVPAIIPFFYTPWELSCQYIALAVSEDDLWPVLDF